MEMLRQGAEGKVISFISASGGVGKTTMATHLAYHIASLGKRVLLMDFDPGAGLTTLIFGKEASIEFENSGKTIGDLLEAYVKRRSINPQDYIKEVSMGYRDDLKKVYIIPSGDALSDAMNSVWYSGNFPNPVGEVKKFISQISPKFDFIIMDTIPFYERRYTITAVDVSNYVILVTTPYGGDPYRVGRVFRKLRESYGELFNDILGKVRVLVNKVSHTREERAIDEMLEQSGVDRGLRFRTIIHNYVEYSRIESREGRVELRCLGNRKCRDEVRKLYEEINDWLKISVEIM